MVYTPESTMGITDTPMTKGAINQAFEAYATPATGAATQLGDLEAALCAFAPKERRLSQCKQLLRNSYGHLQPEDIIGDFVADLIHRFTSGQYKYHDGRFHHWIGRIWGKWFFPEVETKCYKDANVTDAVNDFTFNDDDETEREGGTLYRVDVDREQANRDKAPESGASIIADSIFRDLDDPTTGWGSLHETTKEMLRQMRKGKTQQQAAEAAGIGERQGVRLMKELRETVAEVAK